VAKKIGELLVQEGLLSEEQLARALEEQHQSGERIGAALIKLGLIGEDTLVEFIARQFQVPQVDISKLNIHKEIVGLIPIEIAQKYQAVPFGQMGNTLHVAMADPGNLFIIDDMRFLTRKNIQVHVASDNIIKKVISLLYAGGDSLDDVLGMLKDEVDVDLVQTTEEMDLSFLEDAAEQAPVVKLVNLILMDAIRKQASDVHIEPYERSMRVRFRIDGILHEALTLPLSAHAPLISRIKVLAAMNIAERRRPQGGQFSKHVGDREVDFRVATVETGRGEMLVLRVLDKRLSFIPLSDLGIMPVPLALYRRMLETPLGMILVSGPTGSGKTTSLYASLQHLDARELNIMTIEDPIEYHFDSINQIQVNPQADLTFAAGLRAVMRLDPNVILVGEIRDRETARTAVQAAMTGHLVLTTIHANDAASAILRLRDLDIEPFLISSVLVGSVAQRLVRRICPHCHAPRPATPAETALYAECLGEERSEFAYGGGCNHCSQTGYYGRIGLFEVLPVSDAIRALLAADADVPRVRAQALREGMVPLRTDGMLKVQAGHTTPQEVMRNAFSLGDPDMLPAAG